MTLVRGIGTLLWQLSSAHKNLLNGNLSIHAPSLQFSHKPSLPPGLLPKPSLSKSSLEKPLEDLSLMKVLENTFSLSGLYN